MNVETKELEQHQVQLTVEVDAGRVDDAKRAAARRLSRQVNIPGFRRGKAPYPVVVRHLGEGAIMEQVLDDLGPKVYEEALDSTELETGGPGELVDAELDPLKLIFNVPRQPVIDLGDYRSLRVDFEEVEIENEAVEEALQNLREARAVLEPVDRPAELGDVVTLDVRGVIGEGDDADELLDDKDYEILLGDEREWPIPGFDDHIVGIQPDETRTFDQAFPDDYSNASLASQLVHFTVVCQGLKSRTLPEADDDFAVSVGEEFETLLDLRVEIRNNLQRSAEAARDEAYREKVLAAVVEGADIQYAPSVLARQVDELVHEQMHRAESRGLSFEDFLKLENKTEEEYRAELETQAAEQIRRGYVLGKVIELEELDVTDDDISTQVDKTASAFGEAADRIREAFDTPAARQSIHMDLLTSKALDRLREIAKGEAPPLPEAKAAEPAAEAAADDDDAPETGSPDPAAASETVEPEVAPEDMQSGEKTGEAVD